jgi:cell division protein FtsB
MLFVLGVLLYLYISPARSLWWAVGESHRRQATVAALSATNARLRAERANLGTPASLEHEARSLGLVRPGEREYVIFGLPAN